MVNRENSQHSYTDRRTYIKAIGIAGLAGLAGCLGGGNGSGDTATSGSGGDTATSGTQSGSYPTEPVTMAIGFSAGGSNDTRYRGFKPYFEKKLGASTVVENRTGASGRIAMNYLYGVAPDGYNLIAQYLPTTILGAALYDTKYDPAKLTPMGTVDAGYSALVVPSGKYEDLSDMVNQLSGSNITMASTGKGTTTHFSAVSVLDTLGFNYSDQVTNVPYDSGAEAGAAVASGDNAIGYSSSDLSGLVGDGRIDVLLVDRPNSSPRYPEAPTVKDILEWDIPVIAGEMAIHGPPGVNRSKVSVVSDAIVSATKNEEYQNFVKKNGLSVVGANAETTRQKMKDIQSAADRYKKLTQG